MKRLKVGDYVRELDGNAVGIVVHIMRDAGLAVVNWPPSQHGLAFHPLRLGEGARAMNTIESWTLSDGERREIESQSSSNLELPSFTLVCVLPLLDWIRVSSPKATSLIASGEYRRR
jgi:hypothetical protein